MSFKMEMIRTASEHPVPSHGGPAMAVTWTLTINDVVIQQEYNRYLWAFNPDTRARIGDKPPISMRLLYEKLKATQSDSSDAN